MLVLQVVNGLARNTAWVAAQTYITGVGAPEQRAGITGRFSFSANVGPFLGPIIVGQAANAAGFEAGFAAMAVVSLGFTLVGLSLAEIDTPGRRRERASQGMSSGFGEALSLVRLRGIQVMLLLTVGRLWVASAWQAFFPLYLTEQGFSPDLIGIVVSANGAASSATSLVAGPLTRLASDVYITAGALSIAALGILISPYVTVVPFVFLPSLLLGASSGVTLPLLMSMVGSASPPGRRGVGLGLRSGANSLSGGVAPVITGTLVGFTGLATSLATSGLLTLVLIGSALTLHRRSTLDVNAPGRALQS
jgi:MFS family permease